MKETLAAWDTIQALRALQEIDNEIRLVADERDRLKGRIDSLNALLERGREDIDTRQRKIGDAEGWFKDQQASLQADRDKIAKLKAKLGAVVKNKEYMAIQRELEILRSNVGEKEDQLQRFTEALESHREAAAEEEAKMKALEAEAEGEASATHKQLEEFEARIADISRKRKVHIDNVPKDVLRRYERVKARREGIAIVRVIDGRCSGCHLNVPPQLQNVLYRRDSLEICPSCNRYIFIDDDVDDDAA